MWRRLTLSDRRSLSVFRLRKTNSTVNVYKLRASEQLNWCGAGPQLAQCRVFRWRAPPNCQRDLHVRSVSLPEGSPRDRRPRECRRVGVGCEMVRCAFAPLRLSPVCLMMAPIQLRSGRATTRHAAGVRNGRTETRHDVRTSSHCGF